MKWKTQILCHLTCWSVFFMLFCIIFNSLKPRETNKHSKPVLPLSTIAKYYLQSIPPIKQFYINQVKIINFWDLIINFEAFKCTQSWYARKFFQLILSLSICVSVTIFIVQSFTLQTQFQLSLTVSGWSGVGENIEIHMENIFQLAFMFTPMYDEMLDLKFNFDIALPSLTASPIFGIPFILLIFRAYTYSDWRWNQSIACWYYATRNGKKGQFTTFIVYWVEKRG